MTKKAKSSAHSGVVPVFVMGVPHSGTTILYKMLALHERLCWFSQYSQRSGGIPGRAEMAGGRFINRCGRVVRTHSWQKKDYKYGPLVPRPGECRSIWRYIFNGTNAAEVKARLECRIVSECRAWRRTFFIGKLPELGGKVEILTDTFDSAKIVHIVRDGRAVSVSIAPKFQTEGDGKREAIEAAARYWCRYIERMASVEGVEVVRYEDFCRSVRYHLRRLIEMIGVPWHRYPVWRTPKVLKSTNEERLSSATEYRDAWRFRRMKELLEKYEYL